VLAAVSAGFVSLYNCRGTLSSATMAASTAQTTMTRPRRSTRGTQKNDFVYQSQHNLPVDGRQSKVHQKKAKQTKMRSQPECLTWDYILAGTGTEQPCDVQFYTPRITDWKQECAIFHGVEQGKQIAWKSIGGGDQLTVSDHVTINFYVTNIVLVQGKEFVAWGKQDFRVLQQRLQDKLQVADAPSLRVNPVLGADATTAHLSADQMASPHQQSPTSAPAPRVDLVGADGPAAHHSAVLHQQSSPLAPALRVNPVLGADGTTVQHASPPQSHSTPVRPPVQLQHLGASHELSLSGNMIQDLLQETDFCSDEDFTSGSDSGSDSDSDIDSSGDTDASRITVQDSVNSVDTNDMGSTQLDTDSQTTVQDSANSSGMANAQQDVSQTTIQDSANLSYLDNTQSVINNDLDRTLDSLLVILGGSGTAAPKARETTPPRLNTPRSADSLLAAPPSTPEGVDLQALQFRLYQREQELERVRGEVNKLKQDNKLQRLHLSEKDKEIQILQSQCVTSKQDLTKSNKDRQRLQKQRQGLDNSSFHKRKQLGQLDSQNTDLRDDNRRLAEQLDLMRDELQVMTAKYESVRPEASLNMAPPMPQFASVASGGARAKTPTIPLLKPCNNANRGKSPYTPRFSPVTGNPARAQPEPARPPPQMQTPPAPNRRRRKSGRKNSASGAHGPWTAAASLAGQPGSKHPAPSLQGQNASTTPMAAASLAGQPGSKDPVPSLQGMNAPSAPTTGAQQGERPKGAEKPAQSQRKAKVTVVGASNMRDLSANLQTSDVDTLTYTNPGCQLHQMAARLPSMIARDTDIAVLHLGTNDALNSPSDSQCLCDADEALKSTKRTHQHTRPDVPMFVCAVPPTRNRKAQPRVDMLNDLYRWHCARSVNLHFVDTGLSTRHLAKDGIHLTPEGKSWLASSIITATRDFRMAVPLRVV